MAEVVTTKTGAPLPWPLSNDIANEATILTENAPLSALDVTFGQTVLGSYKWNTGLVLAPLELVDDAADLFSAFVAETLGQRIALGQNRSFTTGSGTGGPLGLINAATQGVQAASPTAIAWNDIVSLVHSVDAVYRLPAFRPAFEMHDNTLQAIRKLADGAGRPLLTGGENGGHFFLMNFPVLTNVHLPSTFASGNRTVLFGAHSKILIRDVREIRIRSLQERYMDSGQFAFCGLMRSDIALLDAGSHPLKFIIH
jgi:HK97 family phage major capsid protein